MTEIEMFSIMITVTVFIFAVGVLIGVVIGKQMERMRRDKVKP